MFSLLQDPAVSPDGAAMASGPAGPQAGGFFGGNLPLALLAGLMEFGGGLRGGRPGAGFGLLNMMQQQQDAETRRAESKSQKSALATLAGGYDPQTGITWNSGRPGLSDSDKMGLLARAAPDQFAQAQLAKLLPKSPIKLGQGETLVDPVSYKPLAQGPSEWNWADGTPFAGFGGPGAAPSPAGSGGPAAPKPAALPDITGMPAEQSMLIDMAEEKYGLPKGSLSSLVAAESAGRQSAVSPAGAVGLTQLMPGTAHDLGVDPANVRQNIDGGARYLRQQLDAFGGNLDHALAAYNQGPTATRRWLAGGGDPARLPAETQAYVPRVKSGFTAPGAGTAAPVQVAQADTGTASDAAPAGTAPGLPQSPGSVGQIFNRAGKTLYVDRATGQVLPDPPNGFRYGGDGNLAADPNWLSAEIQLRRASKPETNTTIDMKQEGEEAKAEGKRLVDEFKAVQERGQSAADAIAQISIARSIPETDPSGAALPSVLQQKVGNAAVALGFNPEAPALKSLVGRVSDGQSFTGTMQNLVLTKMQAQKGPQTENDAKRIESTVASLGNTPEARDFLLRASTALAQHDVDQQAFYEQWKAQKGSYAGASAAWRERIGSIPIVGVQPSTQKPVFFSEFRRAYQGQYPDKTEAELLNDWRTLYARR